MSFQIPGGFMRLSDLVVEGPLRFALVQILQTLHEITIIYPSSGASSLLSRVP